MTLHTSADTPITCAYWDELVDEDGFLALGRNRYSVTYVCYTDGTYFYAEDGKTGELKYGGPNSLGGASGTNAYAVLNGAIVTSPTPGTVVIKEGVYPLNVRGGFMISGKAGLTIQGVGHVVLRYTYAATLALPVNQMFSIQGACSNVTMRNLTWDMNESIYTNVQRPVAGGLSWIGRVVGASVDTLFEDCRFINSPDCGVVSNNTNMLVLRNCTFDNIGEHCLYIESTTNLWVTDCQFLNFAKWIRGWAFKIASASANAHIRNIYVEPNEDGLGYHDSLAIGAEPMVMSVDGGSNFVTMENAKIIGDSDITSRPIWEIDGYNIYFRTINAIDWNHIKYINQDFDHYCSLQDSVFYNMRCVYFPLVMERCIFYEPPLSSQNIVNNSIMRDVWYVRDAIVHNFAVLSIGTAANPVSNVLLDGLRFINWSFQDLNASYATDTIVRNCYFSHGTTSFCVNAGGTRVLLDGNIFDNDIGYGTASIQCAVGSANTLINNRIGAALTTNIVPATTHRIQNNLGYVSENSGAGAVITAAVTSIIVAHGCSYTPTAADISVILTNLPTADIGDVYFSAIGAANFTINCRNAPGVATAIFSWAVRRV